MLILYEFVDLYVGDIRHSGTQSMGLVGRAPAICRRKLSGMLQKADIFYVHVYSYFSLQLNATSGSMHREVGRCILPILSLGNTGDSSLLNISIYKSDMSGAVG